MQVDEAHGLAESAGAVGALDQLRDLILRLPEDTARKFVTLEPERAVEFLRGGEVGEGFADLITRCASCLFTT